MYSSGTCVEYSAVGMAGDSPDRFILERCRNAPAFVRRNIDACREARGLRPLWGDVARADRARARAVAAVARHRAFLAKAAAR